MRQRESIWVLTAALLESLLKGKSCITSSYGGFYLGIFPLHLLLKKKKKKVKAFKFQFLLNWASLPTLGPFKQTLHSQSWSFWLTFFLYVSSSTSLLSPSVRNAVYHVASTVLRLNKRLLWSLQLSWVSSRGYSGSCCSRNPHKTVLSAPSFNMTTRKPSWVSVQQPLLTTSQTCGPTVWKIPN